MYRQRVRAGSEFMLNWLKKTPRCKNHAWADC